MLKQRAYQVLQRIKRAIKGRKTHDDFDWELYNLHYRGELEDISKVHTQILSSGDYEFSGGSLAVASKIKPLHPNHRLLYETILQLHPSSVIEFGCGGGDHLHNIGLLAPDIALAGCDLSPDQIAFLHKRHPDIKANVFAQNITMPMNHHKQYDLAYSQAVIMHIQTDDSHLMALENMFRVSKKYVVFQENWKRHSFMVDIIRLHGEKRIDWPKIYFHYRISDELKRPHQMVVSSERIARYPVLDDYRILVGNMPA